MMTWVGRVRRMMHACMNAETELVVVGSGDERDCVNGERLWKMQQNKGWEGVRKCSLRTTIWDRTDYDGSCVSRGNCGFES